MYTTYRYWFKYGNEDDELECTTLYHDTLDKAVTYAHRYAKGVRFASVTVEDEDGNILYEICDCGAKVIDYREDEEEYFKTIENNDTVNFELIEELECNCNLKVEDCGMSGKDIDLRWFIITELKTGKEKNLYVKY